MNILNPFYRISYCHEVLSSIPFCPGDLLVVLTVASLSCLFTSCSDDPSYENRFTTTDEYAWTSCANREQYSLFTAILERSHKLDLLGTYGSYTVFAPNNDAITKYLTATGSPTSRSSRRSSATPSPTRTSSSRPSSPPTSTTAPIRR